MAKEDFAGFFLTLSSSIEPPLVRNFTFHQQSLSTAKNPKFSRNSGTYTRTETISPIHSQTYSPALRSAEYGPPTQHQNYNIVGQLWFAEKF